MFAKSSVTKTTPAPKAPSPQKPEENLQKSGGALANRSEAPVIPQAPKPVEPIVQTPNEEWNKLRQNQESNIATSLADSAINDNLKLPVNQDGTLNMFWFDAHEEMNHNGEVFIFGKVYLPD